MGGKHPKSHCPAKKSQWCSKQRKEGQKRCGRLTTYQSNFADSRKDHQVCPWPANGQTFGNQEIEKDRQDNEKGPRGRPRRKLWSKKHGRRYLPEKPMESVVEKETQEGTFSSSRQITAKQSHDFTSVKGNLAKKNLINARVPLPPSQQRRLFRSSIVRAMEIARNPPCPHDKATKPEPTLRVPHPWFNHNEKRPPNGPKRTIVQAYLS